MSRLSAKPLKLNPLHFFANLDPLARVIFLSLGCVSLALVAGFAWNIFTRHRVHKITLAAGDKEGESYILSQAIEKTIEANYRYIKIEVKETRGSSENIKLLEEGVAQLATAQADDSAGSSARTIAVLYEDIFQLVVKEKSGINRFVDLKGKRIGLQQKGGQFSSFLKIADHYGLESEDFEFIGSSDRDADDAFRQNRVDAVFRVRAPGNESIFELVQKHEGRLLAVEQAEAMRIKYPAFAAATIPKGAYKGNPAVPANDLPTIGLHRLLLASNKVDKSVIAEIAAILDEHRQEIANAIPDEFAAVRPLVASIGRPTSTIGTGIPIHRGAIAFYERDQPSYIQENADYLALLLTVVLLLGSWLWQLKVWIERGKKNAADAYINAAISLMNEGECDIEKQHEKLDRIFSAAASALIEEQISQESFRTFNEAYKTAREAIERQRQLEVQEQEKQSQLAEQEQRQILDSYIKAVVELMRDETQSKDSVQKELERLLEEAAGNLITDRISPESFRTFIEAYKTTIDTIEHKGSGMEFKPN